MKKKKTLFETGKSRTNTFLLIGIVLLVIGTITNIFLGINTPIVQLGTMTIMFGLVLGFATLGIGLSDLK